MGEEEEVDRLATSLKSSGVAASWIDAINKAKAIIGINKREEPKIKVAAPSEEQKAKVDAIIKEVEQEIGNKETIEPKTVIEPEKPEILKNEVSKFDDPSFNIAESDMKVEDVVKAEEIFTNDPATLDKEKEGEKIDKEEDAVVMTNDETAEQPADSNEYSNATEESREEKTEEVIEENQEEDNEDTTYEEEKDITKEKTLFDFQQ